MYLVFKSLVTPKVRDKHEPLFNKPASDLDVKSCNYNGVSVIKCKSLTTLPPGLKFSGTSCKRSTVWISGIGQWMLQMLQTGVIRLVGGLRLGLK
jgi:hypothetical protein